MSEIFSSFFTLDRRDLINGLVVAVLGAFLAAVQQGLTAHGLDIGAYDWKLIADVSLTAAGAYISKNLFSTRAGSFAGVVPSR
jgi:hypothetical protein